MTEREMKRTVNKEFLAKAMGEEPRLRETFHEPCARVRVSAENGTVQVEKTGDYQGLGEQLMGKDESVCLDFGNHYVGYVTLKLNSVGSPQDAPAFFRLKFAEVPGELLADSSDYQGWISKGWLQEELLHVDVLPAVISLPRRYAFRYLELLVIDTSKKWRLSVEEVSLKAVSAVDEAQAPFLDTRDALLQRIYRVSLRTLKNCMQSVFEDGPKRDRRLWMGDLRLQALVNYKTFREFGMARRCLYLFAALTRADGRVGACLFTEPEYIVDDTFFFDYSLFFTAALYDYYEESRDIRTARELWDCAYRQLEIAGQEFDSRHVVRPMDNRECFVDWKDGLDKQASAQGIYIYCARRGAALARDLGKFREAELLDAQAEKKAEAARRYLWNPDRQVFLSGTKEQISTASQVWMVLAGVITGEEGAKLLKRIEDMPECVGMVTPYMNHYYTEALLAAGQKEKALAHIKYYWGGMVQAGADTFWELYNPGNPQESPYGSPMANSFCHAWSCTPAGVLGELV